jgi:hypothetical protein
MRMRHSPGAGSARVVETMDNDVIVTVHAADDDPPFPLGAAEWLGERVGHEQPAIGTYRGVAPRKLRQAGDPSRTEHPDARSGASRGGGGLGVARGSAPSREFGRTFLCPAGLLGVVRSVGALLNRHKSWVWRRLALLERLNEECREDLRLGLLSPTMAR